MSAEQLKSVVEVKAEFSRYRAEAKVQSGTVDFQRTFTVNGFYFPSSSYLQLKAFFDGVKLNDGRVVVRSRIRTRWFLSRIIVSYWEPGFNPFSLRREPLGKSPGNRQSIMSRAPSSIRQ
jgi:hypothetical protein